MRATKTIAAIVAVLAVSAGAAFALISSNSVKTKSPGQDRVSISATGNPVKISSSKGGGAILVADDMIPGQTRGDTVTIKNDGQVPVTLSMGASSITADPAAASSIFHTKLFETGSPNAPFYSGTVAGFTKEEKIGDISPGKSRQFTLQAILPSSAGNEAENISTRFNIDWKAVEKTTGPPPKECKLRKIRARFFIFRNPQFRPFVRMVSRYQASEGGKVKVTFFWRNKKGKKFVRGKKIGSMVSSFKKTKGKSWRLNRVWLKKSAKEQRKLFRHPHGFYAKLKPLKTANYCSNYLNVELTIPKMVDRQRVWFMANSRFQFEPGARAARGR